MMKTKHTILLAAFLLLTFQIKAQGNGPQRPVSGLQWLGQTIVGEEMGFPTSSSFTFTMPNDLSGQSFSNGAGHVKIAFTGSAGGNCVDGINDQIVATIDLGNRVITENVLARDIHVTVHPGQTVTVSLSLISGTPDPYCLTVAQIGALLMGEAYHP